MKHMIVTICVVTATAVMMTAAARPSLADTYAYSVQSDGDDNLYRINLNTGAATKIGPVGHVDLEGLSFQPGTGILFGAVNHISEVLVTINLSTGATTTVGSLFPGQGDSVMDLGLAFTNDGSLWMATDLPGDFYSVNPATGMATKVGPQGQMVNGLDCSAGGTVYGLGGDWADNLVTINTATGAATSVGPLLTVSLVDGGIAFGPGGTLWGIEDGGTIFTINPSTGNATVVTTTLSGFESLAIPEPASLFLLALGGIALMRRRQK